MALISSFSMATGERRIFSGTRDADTTTSLPKTTLVDNATFNCELILVTSTSSGAKPTELNKSVKGSFCLVLKTNAPLLLVSVPTTVPLIFTTTPAKGSWFSRPVTSPEISMVSCADNRIEITKDQNNKKAFLFCPDLINV